MCHDLFRSSKLEICKENQKLGQTLEIPVVNTNGSNMKAVS